jgi:hypothetical protein
MLTIDECRKILDEYNLPDERIEIIRDYLYAFCKEIIKDNITNYETSITKTNTSK